MSASSSGDGSSSTTMTMLRMASRKRRGMEARASATCCSNCFRSTSFGHHEAVIVAVVADDALVAERLRTADAAAVQNQRIGRARPALLRQRLPQLLFDHHRI